MTGHVFAMAMAALDEVNGPEGQPRSQDARAEWDKIDWRAHEEQVRRLRQRVFKAGPAPGWAQGREPQKLMLRRRANVLVGVRQGAQRNNGRKDARGDGGGAPGPPGTGEGGGGGC